MNDQLAFSPDEAARRAGVGRTLIFSEIKHGRLEARKAGARTIITANALKAWIESLPKRQGGSPADGDAPADSRLQMLAPSHSGSSEGSRSGGGLPWR